MYDEYQGYDQAASRSFPFYCSDPDLSNRLNDSDAASALAYHYKASELWHPAHTPFTDTLCLATDQDRSYGESDWETLERWFTIQGLRLETVAPLKRSASLPESSPATDDLNEWGPLDDLFGRSPSIPNRLFLPLVQGGAGDPSPLAPTFSAVLTVTTADSPVITPVQFAQVYLFPANQILYQGPPTGGSGVNGRVGRLDLLGVHPGNDLRIYVDRYAITDSTGVITPGGRFIYPPIDGSAVLSDGKVIAKENNWGSSLALRYGMIVSADGSTKLDKIKVILTGQSNTELNGPVAQLWAPDTTVGCPTTWRKEMTRIGQGAGLRWEAEFAPLAGQAEFPLYFVVHVSDTHPEFDGITRWVRDLGGVGPGHKLGGAPLSNQREGAVTVDYRPDHSNTGTCNRVMAMPSADFGALSQPLQGYQLVGLPLKIDTLIGELDADGYCDPSSSGNLRLTLFYNQDDVARLGVDAKQLVVITYPSLQNTWQTLPDTVRSEGKGQLNWVETTIHSSAIYAIAAKP